MEKIPYSFDEAHEESEELRKEVDRGAVKDYATAERYHDHLKIIEPAFNALADKYGRAPFDILDSWLRTLEEKIGSLERLKGMRILDLGCGSTTVADKGIKNPDAREPWVARLFLELGANPVGIDIGNLEGEKFEHYSIDLSQKGALSFLPDKSFDAVLMSQLLNSPHLIDITTQAQRIAMRDELAQQVKRLLKNDGLILEFDERIEN